MTDVRRIVEEMLDKLDPPDPEEVRMYVRIANTMGPFQGGFELQLLCPVIKDKEVAMKGVTKVFATAAEVPHWAEVREGCEHLKKARGGIIRPQ